MALRNFFFGFYLSEKIGEVSKFYSGLGNFYLKFAIYWRLYSNRYFS